jgi:DNA-binding Xre family transcriptional regulator
LAEIFARSLAIYTAEVLSLFELREHRKRESGAAVDREESGSASKVLRSAPPWVREAYRRTNEHLKAGTLPASNESAIRANIIRNMLALALKKQNMTQAELARRMKKSQSVISRIFRDPTRSRLTTLQQIANALDVDISDILAYPRASES